MTRTYIKNWFSNFLPFDKSFVYQGISYRTPENFYQAMKVDKSDLETRSAIAMVSPSLAKKLGRKVKLRSDWEQIKTDVMRYVIREKFKPGTTWYKRLISTNEEIVEWNNWGDRVWGKTLDGKGENRLGIILMDLREEYQQKN
jgi:ribA/ribD-fused uncharacterized protein